MPKINRDRVEIYYEVHGSEPPLLLTQRDARLIELPPEIRVPSLVVVGAEDAPFLDSLPQNAIPERMALS